MVVLQALMEYGMALVICVSALVFCTGVAIWVDGFKGLLIAYASITLAIAVATPFTVGIAHIWEAPVVGAMITPFLHAFWIGIRDAKFGPKPF